LVGNKEQGTWREGDVGYSFFDAKEDVVSLLNRLGIRKWNQRSFNDEVFDFGDVYELGKTELVRVGLLANGILSKFDIDIPVYYAELQMEAIYQFTGKKSVQFSAISKYPSVKRDLALLLNKDVAFSEVKTIAEKVGKQLIKNIELFDIYEDAKIGEDKKSYAVSFTIQDQDKTLTDKEVDKLMDRLIKEFEQKLNATLR